MAKTSLLPVLPDADVDGTETLPVIHGGAMRRILASSLIQKLAQPYIALAQAWASSATPPDPADPASKSAKTIADELRSQIAAASLNPVEFERSGYKDAVVDEGFRIIEGVDGAGRVFTEGVRTATAASDLSASIGLLNQLEFERSGFREALVDEGYRMLSSFDKQGAGYIEGIRVAQGAGGPSLPALPAGPLKYGLMYNGSATTLAWELAASGGSSIGRMPSIVIAGSNCPDYIKAGADVVLTGTDDNVAIQAIIDGFPTLPDFERSKVLVTGAKCGLIHLSGKINISTRLIVPAGSVISITGDGCSSWRPIDTVDNQYEGGTLIYSTDPSGRILGYPQYTGNRTDTGASNTIPASCVVLRDIELRVLNPVATAGFAALNLDGMTTGQVQNVNVLCDLHSASPTPRISMGVSLQAGARSDRKTLHAVHSFFFRDFGFNINTTHLSGDLLVAGNINGGSRPSGFMIQGDQNVRLRGLHAFSSGIGVRAIGDEPLVIESIMFESLSTPIEIYKFDTPPVIKEARLNHDVPWTGHIATYCVVPLAIKNENALLRSRQEGTATIPAGATSVSVPHNLIGPARRKSASPGADPGGRWWVTIDATNITITVATPVAADTPFDWRAEAA